MAPVTRHAPTDAAVATDALVPSLWQRMVDPVLEWRNRKVSDPRFQRQVAAFWPTRWVARHKSRRLFDLVAGFVYSQVLLACVRLDLFSRLADGPRRLADLAPDLGLDAEPARRLMEAAVALGLLERRGAPDRFGLGELGAALVANPGALAMIEHHAHLYQDLADPVALLRGTHADRRMETFWGYARGESRADLTDERVAEYSALMAATNTLVSEDLLAVYPFDRHRCLLDVGGGEGVFLAAALARHPHLSGMLFDLPPVAARAQDRLSGLGLADRVTVTGGDFATDPLPRGADVISCVRILHDHDDDLVRHLLAEARAALAPDGALVVAEPMAGISGAEPVAAYFLMYLMALGSGQPRSPRRLAALLREAGFARVRRLPSHRPLLVQVIEARL